MMLAFDKLSLRQKLAAVTLFTSLVALLLAGGTILACQVFEFRSVLAREISTQAEIVGANCSAAMAFNDQPAAEEALKAFKARQDIVSAVLFDMSGNLFAEYRPQLHGATPPPRLVAEESTSRFQDSHFIVFRPVFLGADRVGTIALITDLREQASRLMISAGIMVLALVAAVAVSILLSVKLQQLIAHPLHGLAQLAQRITAEKDYSLRAKATTHDEMGVLVDGINRMLSEIQKRDTELRESEIRFRQLAEAIREVFWVTDIAKKKIIYISPGYEQVWGRKCSELESIPYDWMAAIHPDDVGRVIAALSKQVHDKYDEEYRIIRPDGSIRWVHDRAFAIKDAEGKVYRLAGLAEDITARKSLEKQLLEISDREQSRIGQDLHDGLSQYLVRIGFAANVLLQELEKQNHPESTRAKKIADLIDRSITQTRNLARGLYPVKLETEGLSSGLQELAASVAADDAIQCEVECTGDVKVKDYAVSIHLYRIAQEAVTNSIKHASATRVVIGLCRTEGKLRMFVADDGKGIVITEKGMGLHIMDYRAKMIGAALEILSRPEGGTIVSCVLQLQADENMRKT